MDQTLEIAMKAVQIYAETHPRPAHVTQGQAAQMLEVSRHTITRLLQSGVLSLDRCGLIPTHQVDMALTANKRRAA